MRVLVTGGAGYIGSHSVREMINYGYNVVVLDDLSNGHKKAVPPEAELIVGSTSDYNLLINIFHKHKINAVVHFAANIEVGESVIDPLKYYQNNFSNSVSLLRAMHECEVSKIVFSSTAAVYGNSTKTPIDEDQPRQPINPYGRSKMMTEMVLEDCAKTYGIGYTILRYFNVAGANPDFEIGEDHHPETHLIPRILGVALDPKFSLKIFGTDYATKDGTCVRDYLHVVDLARAHILALEAIVPGHGEVYNLGSEKGFSVREIIRACESVLGRKIPAIEEGRRAGDPAVLIATSEKIRQELHWDQLYPDIETIVAHAWHWHSTHPQGYSSPLSQNKPQTDREAPRR